jgi:hypothetical protein
VWGKRGLGRQLDCSRLERAAAELLAASIQAGKTCLLHDEFPPLAARLSCVLRAVCAGPAAVRACSMLVGARCCLALSLLAPRRYRRGPCARGYGRPRRCSGWPPRQQRGGGVRRPCALVAIWPTAGSIWSGAGLIWVAIDLQMFLGDALPRRFDSRSRFDPLNGHESLEESNGGGKNPTMIRG